MSETGAIAVIGGTGALGSGLAYRLAGAGHAVVIGSRDGARAAAAAEAATAATGGDITGLENTAAAAAAVELVFVTVPFASQADTLRAIAPLLAGKIVVAATVPLVPPKVARVQLPVQGSAAAIAAAVLGDGVRLVTALHSVSAQKLASGAEIEADTLVFGDDVPARERVVAILETIGLNGVHGGPLDNAVAAEALTSVLIAINRRYKVAEGAGLRITGWPRGGAG